LGRERRKGQEVGEERRRRSDAGEGGGRGAFSK